MENNILKTRLVTELDKLQGHDSMVGMGTVVKMVTYSEMYNLYFIKIKDNLKIKYIIQN